MRVFSHIPTIKSCFLRLTLGLVLGRTAELPCVANSSTNRLVQTAPGRFQLGGIELNRSAKTLSFPAEVRITNEVVEYALVTTYGKTHESILTTSISPTDLHVAVLLLGVKPAADLGVTNEPIRLQKDSTVRIDVQWAENGRHRSIPLEQMVVLGSPDQTAKQRRLKSKAWNYSGSFLHQGLFVAQEEGSIISLIRDPVALINNAGTDRDNDDIHFPKTRNLPGKGKTVTVRLRF